MRKEKETLSAIILFGSLAEETVSACKGVCACVASAVPLLLLLLFDFEVYLLNMIKKSMRIHPKANGTNSREKEMKASGCSSATHSITTRTNNAKPKVSK